MGKQQRPFCRGTKRDGEPCGNRAKAGEQFCGRHLTDTGQGGRPRTMPTDVFLVTDKGQQTYTEAAFQLAQTGLSKERVARTMQIAPRTLKDWHAQGAEDFELDNDTDFRQFYARFEQGRAMFVSKALQRIDKAGAEDWRAAVAALKLIHREEFSEHATVHHEGSISVVEAHADDLADLIMQFVEMLDLTPAQQRLVPSALEQIFGKVERAEA